MRLAVAIVIVSALAACGAQPAPPENQASANEKVVTEANVSGNLTEARVEEPKNQSAEGGGTAKLPPANAGLRFVGTWAATKGECASKPWKFSTKALSATGGPHCSFYKISEAPGGYDVAATCPAKEPVHTDLIRLRFAESAGGMLVESNAIPPTGLIYCGR